MSNSKQFKPPYGVIMHRNMIKTYKRKMKEMTEYIHLIGKEDHTRDIFIYDIYSTIIKKIEREKSVLNNIFSSDQKNDEKVLAIEYKLYDKFDELSQMEKFQLASNIYLVHKSFTIRLELYKEKLFATKNKSSGNYILRNTKNIIHKSKIYDKKMDDLYFEPVLNYK